MAEMAERTHSGIDYSMERTERKKRLPAALRVFGKFGFDEGVAGHFTARDPEHEDKFWVNPFGKSFKQMKWVYKTEDDQYLMNQVFHQLHYTSLAKHLQKPNQIFLLCDDGVEPSE